MKQADLTCGAPVLFIIRGEKDEPNIPLSGALAEPLAHR